MEVERVMVVIVERTLEFCISVLEKSEFDGDDLSLQVRGFLVLVQNLLTCSV